MQNINNNTKTEIIATIDELNQYLNGYVTKAGLTVALADLITEINKSW